MMCAVRSGVRCEASTKTLPRLQTGASPLRRTVRSYVITLHSAPGSLFPFPLEECYCAQADQRSTVPGSTCSWDTLRNAPALKNNTNTRSAEVVTSVAAKKKKGSI